MFTLVMDYLGKSNCKNGSKQRKIGFEKSSSIICLHMPLAIGIFCNAVTFIILILIV